MVSAAKLAWRRAKVILPVVLLYFIVAFYYSGHLPDLPATKAADLVTHAPEFNVYARLVRVEDLHHLEGSQNGIAEATLFSSRQMPPAQRRLKPEPISDAGMVRGI